ncbi:MAG TPA: hypothetical protein VEY12_06870 [Thermoplasmata archaeon]|nr:hypothetical protein [Thermoplasmata archaeon]
MAISVTIAGVVYFTASNLTAQSMVPARPFVAFAPVTVRDGVATITVAAVSRTASVSSYRVNLIAGGAVGRATALPAPGGVATISIGSANYRVAWTDVGGSSTLMSGDPITVTAATGPLPTGTVFTFYLLWSDGSMLQSASWTS